MFKMASIVQGKGNQSLGNVINFLLANARLVLGVGGAAILAIATLAVKRMFDKASDPPDSSLDKPDPKPIKEEAGWIEPSPKLLHKEMQRELTKSLQRMTIAKTKPGGRKALTVCRNIENESRNTKLCITLQEKLLAYYTYKSIPVSELSQAKQCALDICTELQEFISKKHPEMPVGELKLSGSLYSDLQMGSADHVTLVMPLVIEENLWALVSGEETILNAPDLWIVRRNNTDYFPRGSSYWDRFLVGTYLSPKVLVETFHKTVVGSINWPAIGSMLDCVVRPKVSSETLELEAQYDIEKSLRINVLPMIKMDQVELTATPQTQGHFTNMWQQRFWVAEIAELGWLDSEDSGCRQRCVKLLRAVCRSHASLSRLSSSQLINAVLHLSHTESDWTEAFLADRFVQLLRELIGYLEQGCLPGYFSSRVNLFSNLSEEEIEEMGYTLYCAVSDPSILLDH
ncbi:mitochondrial dynamics protein MID51 isoform X2 [Callorhinchus milii]|uniref:Mitochondrial elongation factor 1 n=2 Tax=Callorhinchus milii TaxID=7868 RepID=V9KUL5_CALMI|nr:mitochondrial dynamics protein MID51 isoform X2 [Callorhinchus milii]XP_007910120.1 mitochondrial dynamics protein MID51 isoform X2 [Callorhinchus milii]|eukprot:gi/632986229/ref/XP_007910119.1/ PREDICTED: mitochondrial dynamics protein MID49 isoform X2 [Callorhinchus milii]